MKVMVRIFKSNMWRCLPCFMSSILVTATLLLFEGIKAMFLCTMDGEERLRSSLGISTHLYIYVLLFIGVILILYTVNNYSRVRLRDYGTFLVLGSEKGSIAGMILAEYGMLSAVSYVTGCILGTAFLFGVRKVILSEGIYMELDGQMYLGVVLKTLFYMMMVYAAAVLMNAVYLQGNSLSALMRYDRKKSRLPSVKASLIGTGCGALCFAASCILLANKHIPPYIKMRYGLFLVLAGLFLCFTYIGRLLLYLFSSREKQYYKHLLRVKDLYYRFADNKNIMLLSFVINFTMLIFINKNIVEFAGTDSRYLWKYPYDYVYAVAEEHVKDFCGEIGEVKSEVDAYPCVFLTCVEYGEYIGMPVSAYSRLSGDEEEIRPGEVLGILQKHETDEDMLLLSGQVTIETGEGIRRFEAGKQENRVVFAAQQPESMGILVFCDEDYASLRDVWGGMSLVTQRMPDDTGEYEGHMKELARSADAKLFYSKAELMQKDRKEDITTLIFYVCMGIFLMVSNMAVLAVKVWSEIPVLSGKYGFLKKLGMDDEDVKSNVKEELSICMKIPFVLSFALGMCTLIWLFDSGGYSFDMRMILLFVVLVFVQGCFIAGTGNYGYRLVKNRIGEESGGMIWS